MTQSGQTAGRTFEFLRPGSEPFARLFPRTQTQFEQGRCSAETARRQAYDEFCRCVASALGRSRSRRSVGSMADFQHDVLVRFEEKKLAERFDPVLGKNPRAYVAGVAAMMIRERSRGRPAPASLSGEEAIGAAAPGAERQVSVREVAGIAARMLDRLTPAQRRAILKKYGGVPMTQKTTHGEAPRECVRRNRGLTKLRELLKERGITEY